MLVFLGVSFLVFHLIPLDAQWHFSAQEHEFIKPIHLHPGKLTWNPKIEVLKMMFLFNWVIFRFLSPFIFSVFCVFSGKICSCFTGHLVRRIFGFHLYKPVISGVNWGPYKWPTYTLVNGVITTLLIGVSTG